MRLEGLEDRRVLADGFGSTTYYFDNNGSTAGFDPVSGNWDYTSNFWNTDSNGGNAGAIDVWTNGNLAVFKGGTGTVTIASSAISTPQLTFGNPAGSTVTIAASGTNNLTLSGSAVGGTVVDVIQTTTTSVVGRIDAPLAGSNGLNKTGAGTLILGGGNSFSGSTTVTAGTLVVATNTALGITGSSHGTSVSNGARVQLTGGITTGESFSIFGTGTGGAINNGSGTNTIEGLVTLTGNAQIGGGAGTGNLLIFDRPTSADAINNAGFLLTVSGTGAWEVRDPIAGTGGLAKGGAGTLTLTAVNTYSGPTTVTGGKLSIRNSSALASTSSITVSGALELAGDITLAKPVSLSGVSSFNAGALQNLSGNNSVTGLVTLTAASQINSYAGTLTLDIDSGDAIVGTNTNLRLGRNLDANGGATAGNIVVADPIATGSGTVTVEGTGTVTFSAANTYTGVTHVNGGTLLINGNQTLATGAVTVANSATLGGIGTVGGALTVQSGGKLSPGPVGSTGVLKTADLNLNGSSTLLVAVNGTTPGALHDQLLVTGTVSLGGAILNVSGSIASNPGQVITLIDNDDVGGTDAVTGRFSGLEEGAVVQIGSLYFLISYFGGSGNDVVLVENTPPVITSDGGGSTASVNGVENSTSVTTVTVTDPDTSQTMAFSLSGADANRFSITSAGVLTFVSAPDFENPVDADGNNVYVITVTVQDGANGSDTQQISITVTDVNEAPTDISLSPASIAENSGINVVVGALSTTDQDAGNTFTYTLVSGTGDTDNGAFSIDGSDLRAISSFDFETKSSYSVRVQSTDQGGLFTEKVLTITVTNVNEAPTNINLSSASIAENSATDAVVGVLSTVDPDASSSFTYTLVSGTGDTDNGAFSIDGSDLRASSSFDFETKSSYSVRVQSTDQGGLSTEKVFTITVTDVNEAPTNINLSSATIAENSLINTVIGTLSSVDPDAGNSFTYTLVSGTGGTDNGAFNIDGSDLRASSSFDFETKSSYSVRVQSTDQGGLSTEKVFTITVTDQDENVYVTGSTGNDQIIATYTGNGSIHSWSVSLNTNVVFSGVISNGGNLVVNGLIGTDNVDVVGSPNVDVFQLNASEVKTNGSSVLYSNVETVRVLGLDGNDELTVLANAPVGVSRVFDGGLGSDRITAISGNNVWTLTDLGIGTLNSSANLSFAKIESLVGGSGDDLFLLSGPGRVAGQLLGGTGTDTLSFSGKTAGQTVNLQLNSATSTGGIGGFESYIGSASATVTDVVVGANSDTAWTISGVDTGSLTSIANGLISFVGFESLTGGTANDSFMFTHAGSLSKTLNGGSASSGSVSVDTLDLSAKTTALSIQLGSTNTVPGSVGTFVGLEQFIANGHADTKLIRTSNSATSWSVNALGEIATGGVSYRGVQGITGGMGADTISVSDAGRVSTWTLNTPNGGSLAIPGFTFGFSGIENLTGGTGVDNFVFGNAGSLSGNVNGGSATGVVDTLDLSAKTSAIDFQLNVSNSVPGAIGAYFGIEQIHGNGIAGTKISRINALATSWTISDSGQVLVAGLTFNGIREVSGGPSADTLIGPAVDSSWTISGVNGGTLSISGANIAFTGIENLNGSVESDTFVILPGGSLAGNLDGGAGAGMNSLSYSAWTTGVAVNLAVNTPANATAIAGLTSKIQMVTGGAGDDVLTGRATLSTILIGLAGNDTLIGGSQRDLLFGGTGADILLGRGGDDLLISGSTAFDTNRAALLQVYAEWTSARTFAQRTSNLWGDGSGERANGETFLNTDTVFSDSDVDSLTGGTNQDWFFALATEVTDFLSTGATPDRRN